MNAIRLLLVDDEEEFRVATATALSRRGFEVTQANGGHSALRVLEVEAPDVLVLDLRMPEIDGVQTLAELRKCHADLPVIILTGDATLESAVAETRLGIIELVQKPVDLDQLASRIRRLLKARHQAPLRERTTREVMVPVDAYRWVYADQTLADVVTELRRALLPGMSGEVMEQGHRTVLVRDRQHRFVGVVRLSDILRVLLPPALVSSYDSSCLTGMFVTQCQLIGHRAVGLLIEEQPMVDVEAPLLEAAHLMVTHRLVNLPVVQGGNLVGMVRDKDVLLEVAELLSMAEFGPGGAPSERRSVNGEREEA